MFRAVEVVGVEDNGNLRDNLALSNKHGGREVFSHGDGIRKITAIQIQNNFSFSQSKRKDDTH